MERRGSDRRAADKIGLEALQSVCNALSAGGEPSPAGASLAIAYMVRWVGPRESKIVLRKTMLRRYWDRFYPGLKRAPAARMIASDWLLWHPSKDERLPGSRDDFFDRLARQGIGRVEIRTIINDLDPALD